MFLPFVLFLYAFSLPLAAETLATPRKSRVGLRPPHFFIYAPAETKFPKNSNGGRGLAGFHPPFPRPLAAGPLQHCAKATSVFVRRTFSYMPLRKQSSRGAYIRKKPNLKFGFCLCCGERGCKNIRTTNYHTLPSFRNISILSRLLVT